jgi:hypothetical protein
MALPNGEWTLKVNKSEGTLVLSVTSQGIVSGTLLGDPIDGFWDETSKRLMILRSPSDGALANNQVFTGYYFENSSIHYLTGSFEVFNVPPQQTLFGWYATK